MRPIKQLKQKLLWQARLVLKLGEQFDADQRKVEEDMLRIHRREQQMFSGLSSGGDNLFSLTGKLSSPVPDADRMQRHRLKAWARLFAFGADTFKERVFVTAERDAVDRLCEEYERGSGTRPRPFLELLLPAGSAENVGFPEQLQQFLGAEEVVHRFSFLPGDPSAVQEEQLAGWNSAIDRYFPRPDYGRCQLALYGFSGVRVKRLFLDSFGHDEDELEGDMAREEQQDIVIGLLTEP